MRLRPHGTVGTEAAFGERVFCGFFTSRPRSCTAARLAFGVIHIKLTGVAAVLAVDQRPSQAFPIAQSFGAVTTREFTNRRIIEQIMTTIEPLLVNLLTLNYDAGTMNMTNAKSDGFTRGLLEQRPSRVSLPGILKP